MKLICHNPFDQIHVAKSYLFNVIKINVSYIMEQFNKNPSTKYLNMINMNNDLLTKYNHRTSQTLELSPSVFDNFISSINLYNIHRKDIKPNIIDPSTKKYNHLVEETKSLKESLNYYSSRSWLNKCYMDINDIDGIKGISDKDFNKIKIWQNKAYLCSYYGTPKTAKISAFPINIKRALGYNGFVPYKTVMKLKHANVTQLNKFKLNLLRDYDKICSLMS